MSKYVDVVLCTGGVYVVCPPWSHLEHGDLVLSNGIQRSVLDSLTVSADSDEMRFIARAMREVNGCDLFIALAIYKRQDVDAEAVNVGDE